jgi:hypothetical protein
MILYLIVRLHELITGSQVRRPIGVLDAKVSTPGELTPGILYFVDNLRFWERCSHTAEMVVHELHVNERTMLEVASLTGSSRSTTFRREMSHDSDRLRCNRFSQYGVLEAKVASFLDEVA